MTGEDYWTQVRQEGYQEALRHMSERLDRLSENSEDMDWHRGVEAARFELNSPNWDHIKTLRVALRHKIEEGT